MALENTLDEDTFVITDVAALKALADPTRLKLLFEMTEGPRTVKELAAALGVPQTRLYYHVRMLERHRLIRVASTRMVSGIEERTYEASAKTFTPGGDLLGSSVVRSGVLKSLLDMTAAELGLTLERGPLPSASVPVLTLTRLWLTEEQAKDVEERIGSIMLEYAGQTAEGDDYNAFFTVYRRP